MHDDWSRNHRKKRQESKHPGAMSILKPQELYSIHHAYSVLVYDVDALSAFSVARLIRLQRDRKGCNQGVARWDTRCMLKRWGKLAGYACSRHSCGVYWTSLGCIFRW